ncbi:hypothetical protein SAMN05421837_111122 [Amycolatopsis pretoriensis]|uniref:DUF1795 domain-containing protein n=1 Tax=Amycolatopsis pretoriensis TaxID=218821 RepID=A0A1H5RGV4_9PSEU|nr:hypothetical protein [Amycolatopsis pretoriensis]SEF36701.1 hypothetical protein SAMN05421837_111122 [Amycolatopsis pretoriensis]
MNKKLAGSAVVGAAVLAIVAALIWGGEEAPAAAPPPPPTPTTTTLPYQATKEIYDFPAEPGSESGGFDFEIPVPTGWAVTHDKDRATYRSGELVLETDRVPITQEDALGGLQAIAKASPYGGTVAKHADVAYDEAAEWDYSYVRDGVLRQVNLVGVGVGDVLITIRYEAPQPEFLGHLNVLADALEVSGAG